MNPGVIFSHPFKLIGFCLAKIIISGTNTGFVFRTKTFSAILKSRQFQRFERY